VFVLSVLCNVAPSAAKAADEAVPNHPVLSDRFNFELGGLYLESKTSALLTTAGGGGGVGIDFEDILGLEDRSLTEIVGFMWRFAERWRLEFEYFRLNRQANRTLQWEIKWGGVTFPIGTNVDSTFNFYDARVGAGYSFYKTRDKELGAGLGLHVSGIKASIESGVTGSESGKVLAPLPTLNLYGNFALTDEWALRFRVDWLSLRYEEYGGSLTSTALDVLYQPFRHVGFGLGLRNYHLKADFANSDWHGRAEMHFTGPTAFVTASF
jgi:hypothetical protein